MAAFSPLISVASLAFSWQEKFLDMLFIVIVSNSSLPVPLEATSIRLLLPCLHPDHHDQGHWWSTHCQIQRSVLMLITPDLSVGWWDTLESEWGASNDCTKSMDINYDRSGQTKRYQNIWSNCSLPSLETFLLLAFRATIIKLSSYLLTILCQPLFSVPPHLLAF